MLVFGVDPGTALTGYAVVEGERSGKLRALDYGVIRTLPSQSGPERLATIHRVVEELLRRYAPAALAVEELFFRRNTTTALAVGQARGVVLLAAAQAGVPVWEYTPSQVKQAVSGWGKASKQQVCYMVKALLGLRAVPSPDDVGDALAVALCHLFLAQGVAGEAFLRTGWGR